MNVLFVCAAFVLAAPECGPGGTCSVPTGIAQAPIGQTLHHGRVDFPIQIPAVAEPFCPVSEVPTTAPFVEFSPVRAQPVLTSAPIELGPRVYIPSTVRVASTVSVARAVRRVVVEIPAQAQPGPILVPATYGWGLGSPYFTGSAYYGGAQYGAGFFGPGPFGAVYPGAFGFGSGGYFGTGSVASASSVVALPPAPQVNVGCTGAGFGGSFAGSAVGASEPSVAVVSPPVRAEAHGAVPYRSAPDRGDRATLEIIVPIASAQIVIDGRATKLEGLVRTFHTPRLVAGRQYTMRVTATWLEAGKAQNHSRVLDVESGDFLRIDFTRPANVGHQ